MTCRWPLGCLSEHHGPCTNANTSRPCSKSKSSRILGANVYMVEELDMSSTLDCLPSGSETIYEDSPSPTTLTVPRTAVSCAGNEKTPGRDSRSTRVRWRSVLIWYRILRAHYHWPLFEAIRYALWLAR